MILFGVPIYALVNRKGRMENPAAYMAGGAIWNSNHDQSVHLIKSGFPMMGAIGGSIAGGAFWLMAIRK
ncbi:hypothetical protein H7A76_26655 [Pseudomonas sp. MSSRFD41]|uniref:hypothetical protein n=1 Tax=Pseudomonas sp. MSSRFD41 TaxID=1310370 RepID=UPI00163AD262|nr:hypothetical protein [Pseudomonas sp. MSSRFD41]MBC2659034.1 hypothetical protein [Pseudomonas sp. MSSRFD41]